MKSTIDSPLTTIAPIVDGADTESSLARQPVATTRAHDSPVSPVAEDEASLPLPRLLDSDPSKFRSLKKVIVVGVPGSGTDGVGDALKTLGFRVYDFQAASNRYKRDFPLWLEAARLRLDGRPYTKSDYDKLIGDYNAIVGAPASFINEGFVECYPGVKVILVTRDHKPEIVQQPLDKMKRGFWPQVDPAYIGILKQFLMLFPTSNEGRFLISRQSVREIVRERNLLEIKNSIAWVPLCEFLGVQVPDASTAAPELHDNTLIAELMARPQRLMVDIAKKTSHYVIVGLVYSFTMATTALVSALAVFLGGVGLFKLPSFGSQLLNFLVANSQICDVTRLLAAGMASCTLFCGMILGYSLALVRNAKATRNDPPLLIHQPKNENGYGRGKHGHRRPKARGENMRPERPTLEEWRGVQDDIRKNDAAMSREGRATLEEWKKEKHVTFHVTHKRTEAGQDLPRKVLSTTTETM